MADDKSITTTSNWPERAAQIVVEVTDNIREKGISPLYRLVRIITLGLMGLLLTIAVAILGLIGVIRVLDSYLFAAHQWVTYAILGTIFLALGLILWSKRIKKED
ncbi:MAG: hypothetical protein M0T78_09360 [Actinomycetota bacterium]|nr:hypothetical protein [Actinomycetota bacterium]